MKLQFDPQAIEHALREYGIDWIRQPEYFSSIDSSNDYLLHRHGTVHGRICIVDFQTRGKGRLGKQWHGTAGSNLMFSLGWKPQQRVSSEVSLVVGLALADALKAFGVKGVGLKWPNDILVNEAKLAGVLVEARVSSGLAEYVLGIGLNIRHRSADLQAVERPWTDLAQLGIRDVNRQVLLIGVLRELARRLEQLDARGFKAIREDWLAYHIYQGVAMNYQYQGQRCVGRVAGLDESGALLFESDAGQVVVTSGEVSRLRVKR